MQAAIRALTHESSGHQTKPEPINPLIRPYTCRQQYKRHLLHFERAQQSPGQEAAAKQEEAFQGPSTAQPAPLALAPVSAPAPSDPSGPLAGTLQQAAGRLSQGSLSLQAALDGLPAGQMLTGSQGPGWQQGTDNTHTTHIHTHTHTATHTHTGGSAPSHAAVKQEGGAWEPAAASHPSLQGSAGNQHAQAALHPSLPGSAGSQGAQAAAQQTPQRVEAAGDVDMLAAPAGLLSGGVQLPAGPRGGPTGDRVSFARVELAGPASAKSRLLGSHEASVAGSGSHMLGAAASGQQHGAALSSPRMHDLTQDQGLRTQKDARPVVIEID